MRIIAEAPGAMSRFLIILLILIASCRRCDKEHVYTFVQVSKDYFSDFKDGSYWVFENYDDPTDIDTLTLVNKKTGLNFHYTEDPCDGDYYEYADYQLLSKRTNDTLEVSMTSNGNIDQYWLQGPYHHIGLFCPLTITKNGEAFSVNTYAHDTLVHYPTYTVKDKTYNDVVSMTFTQFNISVPERVPTYLYGRHVGLIDFTVFHIAANARKRFLLKEYAIVK